MSFMNGPFSVFRTFNAAQAHGLTVRSVTVEGREFDLGSFLQGFAGR